MKLRRILFALFCMGIGNLWAQKGPYLPIESFDQVGDGSKVLIIYQAKGVCYGIHAPAYPDVDRSIILWDELPVQRTHLDSADASYSWTLKYVSGSGENATYKLLNYHGTGYMGTLVNNNFATGTAFTEDGDYNANTETFYLPAIGGGKMKTITDKYIGAFSSAAFTEQAACTTVQIYKKAYQVYFELNHGGELPQGYTDVVYTHSKFVFPPVNTSCGVFLGWAYSPNETDPQKIYQAGTEGNATQSDTLYAIYQAPSFTIKYDLGGLASMPNTTRVERGQIQLPEPTSQFGAIFLGWSETKGDTLNFMPAGALYCVSRDITLYANYRVVFSVLEWTNEYVLISHTENAEKVLTFDSDVDQPGYDWKDYFYRNQMLYLNDIAVDKGVYKIPLLYYEPRDRFQYLYEGIVRFTFVYKDGSKVRFTGVSPYIPESGQIINNTTFPQDTTRELFIGHDAINTIASGSTLTYKTIHVLGSGKLVIEQEANVTTNEVIMCAGHVEDSTYYFAYPQLVVNGSLNILSSNLTFLYLIDPNPHQYVSLALPYDVNVEDISYWNRDKAPVGQMLWLMDYDGEVRAQTAKTGWRNITNGTLNAGKGYIVYAAPQRVSIGENQLQYQKYCCLRFPMTATLPQGEVTKYVPVSACPAQRPNDTGWNLIGNPFLANFGTGTKGLDLNTDGEIHYLELQPSGEYIWTGNSRYVVIPSDDGLSYRQELTNKAVLPPFKNFFVQIDDLDAPLLEFAIDSRVSNAQRRFMTSTDETMIRISMSNTQQSDIMGILIGEQYTSDYEINGDLQKWDNQSLNFYALSGQDHLAYIAVNDTIAKNISVGYSTLLSGIYTFAIEDNTSESDEYAVWLYDSESRTTTDITMQPYSVYVQKGSNNTRFMISVISLNKPTRIEYNLDDTSASVFYDLLGRPVSVENLQPNNIYIQGRHKIVLQ